MKSREEPSADSTRGSKDSLSRSGSTVSASAEQPALSLFPERMMEAVVAKAEKTAQKKTEAASEAQQEANDLVVRMKAAVV